MNYADISGSLSKLGVSPPDLMRAALFLDQLTEAHTFLTTTLAKKTADGGLGAECFAFAKTGLTATELLNQLAVVLDGLVQPAVQGQLTKAGTPSKGSYEAFFTKNILPTVASGKTITAAQFATNLKTFFTAQPVTEGALKAAESNFTGNIKAACTRLFADVKALQSLYADQFDTSFHILGLKRISVVGAAFYNRGQQALDLELVVSGKPSSGSIFSRDGFGSTIWVTYEPRDLEIECLISGDTTAVNRAADITFQTNSLFEIYNKGVVANTDTAIAADLVSLPTLLILPRNPSSTTTPPIANSYGYRQSLTAPQQSLQERMQSATLTSDVLISADADTATVVSDFYLTLGAVCALSSTFSLTGLSASAILASELLPKFPNTSAALISPVASWVDTGLFDTSNGSGGVSGQSETSEIAVVSTDKSALVWQTVSARTPNRLWQVEESGNPHVLELSAALSPSPAEILLQGFDAGTAILKALYSGADKTLVESFVSRTDNVAVTAPLLTCATTDALRNAIFADLPCSGSTLTLEEACNVSVSAVLSSEYDAYKKAGDATENPSFIALSPLLAGKDYQNLDTPMFYHQIGSKDILTSDGTAIPIPPSITAYLDPKNPSTTTTLDVKGASGFPSRGTFYADAPSASQVISPQVSILGTSAGDQRAATFRTALQKALGLGSDFAPTQVVAPGQE